MALRKAANADRHPAERLTSDEAASGDAQVFALPERVGEIEPDAAHEGERPSVREAPSLAEPPMPPAQPSDDTVGTSPVTRPSRPVRPRAPAGPSNVRAALVESSGGGEVRRTKVSNRGKENATFRWPRADAETVKQALRSHAPAYRAHHRGLDVDGTHRLSLSPFAATALTRALDHPGEWIGSVRNDGRKEPIDGGTSQVGLVWDRALSDRLHEAWERFDAEMSNESFALTKANMAIAGIVYEIRRADEWVLDVPNDDRFSEPTPIDRRIRAVAEQESEAG